MDGDAGSDCPAAEIATDAMHTVASTLMRSPHALGVKQWAMGMVVYLL
jgi:hypothetical protein